MTEARLRRGDPRAPEGSRRPDEVGRDATGASSTSTASNAPPEPGPHQLDVRPLRQPRSVELRLRRSRGSSRSTRSWPTNSPSTASCRTASCRVPVPVSRSARRVSPRSCRHPRRVSTSGTRRTSRRSSPTCRRRLPVQRRDVLRAGRHDPTPRTVDAGRRLDREVDPLGGRRTRRRDDSVRRPQVTGRPSTAVIGLELGGELDRCLVGRHRCAASPSASSCRPAP